MAHSIYLKEFTIFAASGMRKIIPYSNILDFLTELIDNKTSGTLFVNSESNRAITVALDKGRIHALYFGARRGRKAIPLISEISGGSYRFEVSSLIEASHDLPSTPEILNQLRNPNSADEPSPTVSTTTSRSEAVKEEKKEVLCQELKSLLLQYMGPIAEIVFDDTVDEVGDFCATPRLTEELINKLSEEIDNASEVEQFRSKAYLSLKNIMNS